MVVERNNKGLWREKRKKSNEKLRDLISLAGDHISIGILNNIIDEWQKNTVINEYYPLYEKFNKGICIEKQHIDPYKQLMDMEGLKSVKKVINQIIDNTNKAINVDYNSYINLINVNSTDPNIDEAFKGINENTYNILITHYPDTFSKLVDQCFDYCLAGHSLGGQVNIPIINLFDRPHGASEYLNGTHITKGKTLDITNGVGRKTNNVRFLADNEIVVYRLNSISNPTANDEAVTDQQ